MEGVKKRNREESVVELPEVKKSRYDIFDTLDDVEVDLGVDSEVSELTSVMKSFEEEIELAVEDEKSSLLSSAATTAATAAVEELDHDLSISEIGWLLEASDDELGLPPNGCKEQLLPLPFFEHSAEDGWEVDAWEVGCGGDDGGREECLGYEDLFGYEDAASHFQRFS